MEAKGIWFSPCNRAGWGLAQPSFQGQEQENKQPLTNMAKVLNKLSMKEKIQMVNTHMKRSSEALVIKC